MTTHGINAGDVKKLQDAGIYTCNGLMMHTKKVNIDSTILLYNAFKFLTYFSGNFCKLTRV